MAVWWQKTSSPPSSCVMKPKPFASLNHFTVPVAICRSVSILSVNAQALCRANLLPSRAGKGPTLYPNEATKPERYPEGPTGIPDP